MEADAEYWLRSMPTAVAAAASVPASSTRRYVFWNAWLMKRSGVPVMRLKSAAPGRKASSIPRARNAATRESEPDSISNRGRRTWIPSRLLSSVSARASNWAIHAAHSTGSRAATRDRRSAVGGSRKEVADHAAGSPEDRPVPRPCHRARLRPGTAGHGSRQTLTVTSAHLAHPRPSGGRRIACGRCTRARHLFREPGSVSGAGGSRTRVRE
jgi:hypothetical protein